MNPTENQQIIIDAVDSPVVVQAGAGCGKTFTLTERIVSAIKSGKVDSIESVVAITFTHKAAEELKSRIRLRLNEEGLFDQALLVDNAYISTIHGFASRILHENALTFGIDPDFELIDEGEEQQCLKYGFSASSTASMAGIGDLSAFLFKDPQKINTSEIDDSDEGEDLILDPDDFTIEIANADDMDEEELSQLEETLKMGEAIEIKDVESIKIEDQDSDDDDLENQYSTFFDQDEKKFSQIQSEIIDSINNLFKMFNMDSNINSYYDFITSEDSDEKTFDYEKLFSDVYDVMNKCSVMPNNLEAITTSKNYLTDKLLCEDLTDLVEDAIEELKNLDSPTDKELEYIDGLTKTLAILNLSDSLSPKTPGLGRQQEKILVDALKTVPCTTNKFRSKADDSDFWCDYRRVLAHILLEFLAHKGSSNISELVKTCKNTYIVSRLYKTNQRLSNGDLLRICYECLCVNTSVATSLREKIKMIMIDEFQDTDRLQLALISTIAKEDFSNICVVGDLQQSIYRFRSADINVFREFKKKLSEIESSKIVSLPDNYRSHQDILAFCKKIFSSKEFFGDEFLELNAAGSVNENDDKMFEGMPRVRLDVVHNQSRGKVACSSEVARQFEALQIAEHFKELIARGAKREDFALLLGNMTHAKVYQDALMHCGIPSLITGGSLFGNSKEAHIVRLLVNIARNFLDDRNLLELLKSDIFCLSDDTILALTTKKSSHEENKPAHSDLSSMFFTPEDYFTSSLSDAEKSDFGFAQKIIVRYLEDCKKTSLVDAIRNLLISTGTFDKLESLGPDGLVSAGNYEKSLVILSKIQEESPSICETQERFSSFLDNSREKPGILSSLSLDFMEIMTVHASKGLEFDHVAIAELRNGNTKSAPKCAMMNTQDKTYIAKISDAKDFGLEGTKTTLFGFDDYKESEIKPITDSITTGQLYRSICAFEDKENLDEAKRLLYVAITRAIKSVFLAINIATKPDEEYEKCGMFRDLKSVLEWDVKTPAYTKMIDFGGSGPLEFNFRFLPVAFETDGVSVPDAGIFNSARSEATRVHREPKRHKEDRELAKDCGKYFSYTTLEVYEKQEYLEWKANTSSPISQIAEDDDRSNEHYYIDSDKATKFGERVHGYMENLVKHKSSHAEAIKDTRLNICVKRIISTDAFMECLKSDTVIAEMPFFVKLPCPDRLRFLRGTMDLVSVDGTSAHIIDYKTGTKPKDHALQAQVYAYALLENGFDHINVDFLHAEIQSPDNGEMCATQHFEFNSSDREKLAAYLSTRTIETINTVKQKYQNKDI